MNKIFKVLAGNTIVFALGNGATLIISFFMIPVYTSVLSTKDFGISDIIVTTIAMLSPVFSLNIFTAVFRWALDNNNSENEIYTNGLLVSFVGSILSLFLGCILWIAGIKYSWAIGINLAAVLMLNHFQNFTRGINKIKLYSFSGLVGTFVNVISNILLMIILPWGIKGYLISLILGNVSISIFLIIFGRLNKYWDKSKISKEKIKTMLIYSMPMIPNSFTWWMTNDASRVIIMIVIGPAGNGLYAVANKIPSLITTLFGLFQNAWQISAVDISKGEEAEKVYTVVFNIVLALLFFGAAVIVSIIKYFMRFYVANSYYEAWKFIPILLLTAVFSNISAFLGTTYLVKKKTKGLFSTTIWGMIINVILSILLIPLFGLYGASFSGAIGFLFVSTLRLKQTSEWITIKIEWKLQVLLISGYLVISSIEYLTNELFIIKIIILSSMFLFILFYIKRTSLNTSNR